MDWLQAISVVGFPIVCCLAMAWYVKYMSDQNNLRLDNLNKQHAEEMKEVTNAINNNTIALTKLTDSINKEV